MNTRLKTLSLAALVCCALTAHTRAHAQIAIYTDRDGYLRAVGAAGVDTYDDRAPPPRLSSCATAVQPAAGALSAAGAAPCPLAIILPFSSGNSSPANRAGQWQNSISGIRR